MKRLHSTKIKLLLLDQVTKTNALNSLALQLQRPYLLYGLITVKLALLVKLSAVAAEIDLFELERREMLRVV